MSHIRTLTIATLLALAPVVAAAQTSPPAATQISIEQARQIATQNGVAKITEIKLDDGKWEIEGRDQACREIEIDLDAKTGSVTKLEKD